MAKYTYNDIIIDPEDPRLEIGAEYYYCGNPIYCLHRANNNDVAHLAGLEKVYPNIKEPFFIDDTYSICIIRKKEPEKKYVPFDLSKPEARDKLRFKYLIQLKIDSSLPEERLVLGFSMDAVIIGGYDLNCFDGHELLENFTFLDGSPCGELVEITEDDNLSEAGNDN